MSVELLTMMSGFRLIGTHANNAQIIIDLRIKCLSNIYTEALSDGLHLRLDFCPQPTFIMRNSLVRTSITLKTG